MKVIPTRMRQTISRAEAAVMLRGARKALAIGDDRAGETIGWTLTALRDNYHARLIKIDYLLRTRHWDSADALMARTIMHLRDHPLLRLRLAKSFFEQGRIEQAAKEIRRVRKTRPEHAGALMLAARIARVQGHHKHAATLWMQAADHKPLDRHLRAEFIQSLLDAGLAYHAAAELARLPNPPALLRARVLRAESRSLEAIECLERALAADDQRLDADPELNGAWCELMKLLEETGDSVRLARLLMRIDSAPFEAQCLAAAACLGFGEFESAKAIAARLAQQPHWRDRAQRIMHVASAVSELSVNENTLEDGQSFTHSHGDPRVNRVSTARLWLLGMLGRLLHQQVSGRTAGADPCVTVLQPLMRQALHALRDEPAAQIASPQAQTAERHAKCLLAALGSTTVRTRSQVFADGQVNDSEGTDDATLIRRAA